MSAPASLTSARLTPIEALHSARSIAIIGASSVDTKPSGRTQRYLRRYGFTGKIFPVNPNSETIQGEVAYSTFESLPEIPDIVVIVLPAAAIEKTVRECGNAGVPLAIVFASGFAEVGEEGALAQDQVLKAAQETGIRVLGPNSVGAVSFSNSVMTTFMTGVDQDRFEPKDDKIAFVSQSGAMGGFILNLAQTQGIGVGTFVSTGNEADLTLPDVMQQLVDEGDTKVLLGYVEGIRDGAAFKNALESAIDKGIPVGVLKVGRSERGAQAAASHTGALAGSDVVFDGLFQEYGAQRAESVEDLLDLARVLASPRRPQGNNVSIVTLSGGAGVLMTDIAEDLGLTIFPWDEPWQDRLHAVLPQFAATANPIDVTGGIASDLKILDDAVRIALENPDTDQVVVLLGNLEAEEDQICEHLLTRAASSEKPLLVTWVGGSGRPQEILSIGGVPTFSDPARAMRAAAASARWSLTRQRRALERSETLLPDGIDKARAMVEQAAVDELTTLNEVLSKKIVAAVGISVVQEAQAFTPEDAATAAEAMGYPVVVKLLSDEVPHKSELGAVRTGIGDKAAAIDAATAIVDIAAAQEVTDRRLVVQQQLANDLEIIVGTSYDETFGTVVLVGIGGVAAEVMPDVQVRLAPVSESEARRMIGALRGVKLLRGVRGRRGVDEDALAATIARLSGLAAELSQSISSIDLNPLLVLEDGQPIAVDALVVLREAAK